MNRLKDTRNKGKKRPSKRSKQCIDLANKRWKSNLNNSDQLSKSETEYVCINEPGVSTSNLCDFVAENRPTNEPGPSTLSASERKLRAANFEATIDLGTSQVEFSLVHSSVWKELYTGMLCIYCGKASLCADTVDHSGFAFKIRVTCKNCNSLLKEISSSPRVTQNATTRSPFEVNRRMVDSFLSIGRGYAGMQQYSMVMGMTCMASAAFSSHVLILSSEYSLLNTEILRKAHVIIREAYIESGAQLQENGTIDISVSYDGTWMKRGHSSLYGIGIVIDMMTGLVLDYEILSKYCSLCVQQKKGMSSEQYKVWYKEHKASGTCEANFEGSSNAMEAAAAEILWKRSVNFSNFRYMTMLSDGDAKTFKHLQDLKVYGSAERDKIDKEECINHVAKRVCKGLQNTIDEWKKKNVTLGGKKPGSLTADSIARLQMYYRKAITNNIPDISAMKKAIYATLRHCGSTDKNPQHGSCPIGPTSWCFYNRAIAAGEDMPKHNDKSMGTYLRPDVISKIMPVYQRLASDEILRRCTLGKTQNANESLHSVIWHKCPKEVFVSKKRLQVAVTAAISEFNFGCSTSLKLQSQVRGTEMSPVSLKISQGRDRQRLRQAATSATKTSRTSRRKMKLKKSATEQLKKKQEGPTHESGGF